VTAARDVWDRLTRPCIPAPEPPVRDRRLRPGGDPEFPVRLANLGTVERTRRGFKVTANSVRRAAGLTAVVADAVAAVGRVGKVTSQPARTADEMLGNSDADGAPDGREAMCRRLGLGAALTATPPRELATRRARLRLALSRSGKPSAEGVNPLTSPW